MSSGGYTPNPPPPRLDDLSIQDAVYNIQLLDDLPIFDDLPVIESSSTILDVHTNFDTNFQDREAFINGVSKYIEEATRHGEFNVMLSEGFRHAATLYTWRCCSRSVPMIKSNDQPDRPEINRRIAEVFQPEIQKLVALVEFVQSGMYKFTSEVARLSHPEKRKDFVSEAYLLTLGRMLNIFIVLDELKNMKASMKNDLSTYRRAVQATDVANTESLNKMSMFFATQNQIRDDLKAALKNIEGYEELLADILNIYAHFFEQKFYLTPAEKHMYVKVMAFALFLIDGSGPNVAKLDQKKRISISRFDKIFKSLYIVPLFGDMPTYPFDFVTKSPHYDSSKWPLASQKQEHCQVNVVEKAKSVRIQHDSLVLHMSRLKNDGTVCDREGPKPDSAYRELTELSLECLHALCDWTSSVIELVTWKLAHPASNRTNSECPAECDEDYEKATRYNYTPAEKAAIVEIVAMVKGTQRLLATMESDFSVAIRRHSYAELQDFIQISLAEPLHKAVKHKRDLIAGIIKCIIETCTDGTAFSLSHSSDLSSDSKSKKKSKDHQSMGDIRPKRRNVAPSFTQLYLARTMLESLVSEKPGGGGRRVLRKDIDPKHLDRMLIFLRNSYFWPALFKLSDTVDGCCDMSQFWFREFYLEMSMGRRIQFPIEMSIPWILTDHILTAQEPELLECALFQLDLYNDAALYSLKRFRKQHLYDEVEAEVNLCFDQFIFKLSDAVFTHYKQLAASMLLDKGFKQDCARFMQITLRTPPAARFEAILKQRHVQLLGRSIDLNHLISQRINVALANALDVAISKFESEGLWFIVGLEQLIETNRLCHRLLSEYLNSLGDFEDMLVEANHGVYTANGRITLHVYIELVGDIIPNYYYNTFTQRFVRGKLRYRSEPEREKFRAVAAVFEFGSRSLNAAFSNLCAMHKNYIGVPHFAAMGKLLGYQGACAILEELLSLSENILHTQIRPQVSYIRSLVDKECRLPKYEYGAEGIVQYFLRPVRKLIDYEPLKREFAQGLRQLGNILTFCFQLESGMAREDLLDLHSSAPFTNAIPKPPFKNTNDQQQRLQRLEEQAARIQIAAKVQVLGTEVQTNIANEAELLTKERLCCGLNIFERVLNRLSQHLVADTLFGAHTEPKNGVMHVDECDEFHRLWSHVQYAYYILHMAHIQGTGQTVDGAPSLEEIFGDSIHWAAMAIIRVMGQHRRFEVLDFGYHLLRVYRAQPRAVQSPNDKKSNAANVQNIVQNISLEGMIDRIRRQQALNNHILSILNCHVALTDREQIERTRRDFGPPVHHRAEVIRSLPPLMDPNTNRNLGVDLTQLAADEPPPTVASSNGYWESNGDQITPRPV